MNRIFLALIVVAFGSAAWRQIDDPSSDAMAALSRSMTESASSAVELAIGLVGVMSLFLGLMKIAEEGGLLVILAFPEVPPDHPAMGAMILNISANMMGLGNAATPFGIRAMQALNRLNPAPGTATNPMILFLAINTSSVTLLPTGVIAMRAAAGSNDPAAILPTTLFATLCSTVIAIATALLFNRLFPARPLTGGRQPDQTQDKETAGVTEEPGIPASDQADGDQQQRLPPPYPGWVSWLTLAILIALIPLAILYGATISPWVLPTLMLLFLLFGAIRRVAIYEAFVEGAKEGFQVALRIIPYLVAILVAVGMLRASGALEAVVHWLGRFTAPLGLPPEALPMALLRPLSGSGAYGVMTSIIEDPAIGPDSYTGLLVSTLQGSTETTFYVLAVYFGAVQIRRIRHALAVGLIADLTAVVSAVVIVSLMIG